MAAKDVSGNEVELLDGGVGVWMGEGVWTILQDGERVVVTEECLRRLLAAR